MSSQARAPDLLIRAAAETPPEIAVVLGSGMSPLAGRIRKVCSFSFLDVPGLAAPTVESHKGAISLGHWAGKRVLAFEGRLHFYEGNPWRRIERSVQIAASLGVRQLLLTNTAGGIHAFLATGSLMAVRDHIEWTRPNCWRQPGPGGVGPERPSPYAPRLLRLLDVSARGLDMRLQQGIYAAVTGPNYETPAEVRALKAWGADAVGMSTTREARAGFRAGLECAALSCITNRAAGLSAGPIHHEEVLTNAAALAGRLGELIEAFLRLL